MTFKRREVEQALQKKGFEKSKGKHKHSIFIYYTSEGKKTDVRTLTSHGSGGTDIGDPLLGRMASQCKISKLRFEQLIECPLSRECYEDMLRDSGALGERLAL